MEPKLFALRGYLLSLWESELGDVQTEAPGTGFLQTTPHTWGHAPCGAEAQRQSPGRAGVSPDSFLVKITNLLLLPQAWAGRPQVHDLCVVCAAEG